MRVLFLTDRRPDYLADDLLYGLRALPGIEVVDWPRKELLYRARVGTVRSDELYGAGFHCFGLADDAVDRSDLARKIVGGWFDLIIAGNAWRLRCPLHPSLVVLDGQDYTDLNDRYAGRVALYFKRELPRPLPGIEPVLLALPDFLDRTVDAQPARPRTQRVHASFRATSGIREELARLHPPRLGFRSWKEYAAAIASSWFALSPRGAGYDCQRHYEILGRAVLCIDLDADAPFALKAAFRDGENCLTFASVDELTRKIDACKDPLALIERGRADLASHHLASRRAEQLLERVASAGVHPGRPRGLALWHWIAWRALARWVHGGVPKRGRRAPR